MLRMNPYEILGFIGAALVAIAYVPQIMHIITKHCAYGISVKAWLLWLIASFLILPHALTSGNAVFMTLQIINTTSILFILVFAQFHKKKVCKLHRVL